MTTSKNYKITGTTIVRIARLFEISLGEAYETYNRFLKKNDQIPDAPEIARELFNIELKLVRREDNLRKIKPYIEKYSIKSFYHLTHISNLKSILEKGILAKNELDQNEYVDISDQNIQRVRNKKKILDQEDKTLHDFVPLFWSPNPPMLYAIKDEYPQDILYLQIRPEVIALPYIVFTDGNARSLKTMQYRDLDQLDSLDWELLRRKYWRVDNPEVHKENKRKRAAEILIPSKIDPSFIFRISTKTKEIQKKVIQIVRESKVDISIQISPDMY